MGDFIHVEIKRAPGSSAKLQERNFVIGISSVAIAADIARGKDSLVRKHFGDMPTMVDYVKRNLSEIQRVIAGQIAFCHANKLHALQPRPLPAELHFSFPISAPRSTDPDVYVGDSPLWYISN